MALSIDKISDESRFVTNAILKQSDEDQEHYEDRSQHEDKKEEATKLSSDGNYKKVHQGLQIFVDSLLPSKKMLSELKGLAEMDATGLQLFLAMQRQFFNLKLLYISDDKNNNKDIE